MEAAAAEDDGATVGNGAKDAAPLAVAKVDEEFFHAAAGLDEGMTPRHDAVYTLAVGHVVHNAGGMMEGKREVVAAHGEYAAVTVGKCLYGTGKVGGVGAYAEVGHHVDNGNDCELGVEEEMGVEDGFVEGFSAGAMGATHGKEVGA